MIVLLIEDDPVNGSMLTGMLRRNGWHAEWAPNLHSARTRLKVMDADLLIMDVHLPDGDGLDLLRNDPHLKNRKVIVLTSVDNEEVEYIKKEFPDIDVVQKPVEPVDLIRVIEQVPRRPVTPPKIEAPPAAPPCAGDGGVP